MSRENSSRGRSPGPGSLVSRLGFSTHSWKRTTSETPPVVSATECTPAGGGCEARVRGRPSAVLQSSGETPQWPGGIPLRPQRLRPSSSPKSLASSTGHFRLPCTTVAMEGSGGTEDGDHEMRRNRLEMGLESAGSRRARLPARSAGPSVDRDVGDAVGAVNGWLPSTHRTQLSRHRAAVSAPEAVSAQLTFGRSARAAATSSAGYA